MIGYLVVAYDVDWGDGDSRNCCSLEELQCRSSAKELRSDGICHVVHCAAHTIGVLLWNSQHRTSIFILYKVTSSVLSFASGRPWLNLSFTHLFIITDVMIRQKGLKFEELIMCFVLFLFYLKQQKTKVSISRLFVCSSVLLPRHDHWKQAGVTGSWWCASSWRRCCFSAVPAVLLTPPWNGSSFLLLCYTKLFVKHCPCSPELLLRR